MSSMFCLSFVSAELPRSVLCKRFASSGPTDPPRFNSKFWKGLPDAIKPQVDKAMKEASDFGNKIAAQENVDALEAIKKSGKVTIYEVSAADKKTWMDAMLPVHEWAVTRCGKEIVDLLHKEAGFDDPKHFSRLFHQRFGISPDQFRKQLASRGAR